MANTAIDKAVLDKAQTKFIRARLQLMSSNPFYASLSMKMPLKWMEFDQPTGDPGLAKTDGKSLYINPTVYAALSDQQAATVVVHEVLHCAAGDLWRCGGRDPLRWNVAGDVYIANLLEAERFQPIPGVEEFFTSARIDRRSFRNMHKDEIYEKLPQNIKSGGGEGEGQSKGRLNGNGNGTGCYHEASSGEERTAGEREWKQNVIEAAQAAKMAGQSAGAWSELVKAAMPKLPFHLKLFEYLNRGIGGEIQWETLNRRYIHRRMYLPTDTKQVMGETVIAVDTSGSMSNEQLQLAFGYIRTFRDQHPCKLHVMQCDHDTVGEGQYQVYEEYEEMPSEFKAYGRGGTSFDPPFRLIEEKRIEAKVMIYITDGYGYCGVKEAPAFPVLWVVVRGDREFKPPFGETVIVQGE